MRNEEWDMAVKTNLVEDKDSEWEDFDVGRVSSLGFRLHDSRLNNSK